MSRFARLDAPGQPFHIISRFVDGEFRIPDDEARHRYLRYLARAAARTDWGLFGYAVMSSHQHSFGQQGDDRLDRLLRSTNTSFSRYANDRDGRSGPVFLERATTIMTRGPIAFRATLAYIHNNPVRAGLVSDALDSTWTSHRAYLKLAHRPAWLDIERGLELAGFDDSASGREAFHEFTVAQSKLSREEQRQYVIEPETARVRIRAAMRAPVELESPIVDSNGVEYGILAQRRSERVVRRSRWEGDVADVPNLAALFLDLAPNAPSIRDMARIRTLALRVSCEELGRPVAEIAAQLGIARSTASNLLKAEREKNRFAGEAGAIAKLVRAGGVRE